MQTFTRILCAIFGIYMVVVGFYCLFNPTNTGLMLGSIVGVSMIFDAIAEFSLWNDLRKEGIVDGWLLTGAILSLVLGIVVLNNVTLAVAIDLFLAYYIAIWMVCSGVIGVIRACKIHKLDTIMLGTRWYLPLILGILLIVFGILCLLNPLSVTTTLGIFMGLGVITAGCSLFTVAITKQA